MHGSGSNYFVLGTSTNKVYCSPSITSSTSDLSHTDYFSPIPQFDGIDSPMLDSPLSSDLTPTLCGQNVSTTFKARKTDFQLNKDKQLRKLSNDANRPNVEIEINKSRENIHIKSVPHIST